ncbi:MAG: DUF6020 family protein [Olsenella sp.]|nr:DUF6020 family protein [Olsenella sp.]
MVTIHALRGRLPRLGYVLCVVACAAFASVSFTYGEYMFESGYILDRTEATREFLSLTAIISIFLFAVCEIVVRVTDRMGRRRRWDPMSGLPIGLIPKADEGESDAASLGRGASRRHRALQVVDRLTPRLTPRSIIVFAIVLFALWIPYLLAAFPGSMNWDAFYQVSMYQRTYPVYQIPWLETHSIVEGAWLSDHHPVFDTVLYGLFTKTSLDLTGSWNAGVFAFVVLQGLVTAATFSLAIAYLRRLGVPAPLRLGAFLFIAILPFYGMYAFTMVKDSTYGLVFVTYLVFLCEVVRSRGEVLYRHRWVAVCFLLLGVLQALTKKSGAYIVIPTCLVCAVAFRGVWRQFVAQAATVAVIMWVILPHIIFPLFNIIPGGVQEPLNTLFQQTARYVMYHGDEVTDEEKEAIDAVLPYEALVINYQYDDADTVKAWYRYQTATRADLLRYIRVWFQMGLKHPEVYFDQVVGTANLFFNAHGIVSIQWHTGDIDPEGAKYVWHPMALTGYRLTVHSIYNDLLDSSVPLCLLFRVGLYSCWIPLAVLCYLVRRRGHGVLVMLPVLLSIATCLLTPIFTARYALPTIYVAPFLVGLAFAPVRPSEGGDEPAPHPEPPEGEALPTR